MKTKSILFPFSVFLAFIIPVFIILSNVGYFLGFTDAAEFALVTKIGGIAHPPGFPSYILAAKTWSLFMQAIGIGHVKGLIWFSVLCTAVSTMLLFITFYRIIQFVYVQFTEVIYCTISLLTAICFVSGVTAWHWSGNVEVYAFQVLAFSIMLFGMTNFNLKKNKQYIYIAALGISLGLANHHLTMILFLPFLLLFFSPELFNKANNGSTAGNPTVKKKSKIIQQKGPLLFEILSSKSFLLLTTCTFILTVLLYSWMFIRAGADLPYKFGNPDNFSRLIYHISGGSWVQYTMQKVQGLIGLRFSYFMNLTFEQFFLFTPFLFLGIAELKRLQSKKIIYISSFYYILILLYQLRIDQDADTDAYLLPAFFVLNFLVLFGFTWMVSRNSYYIYILPLLFMFQVYVNFPKTDKRKYNVSETLMREIDRSCPTNSTLLIADWTTVIQYYYYRIVENFRPDLVVLNYDLKFTNYKILPSVYPAFYKEIKPEYDRFIQLLGNAHPLEIYDTGCTFDNAELMYSFRAVISKMKMRCEKLNSPFMCDPKAYLFLSQQSALGADVTMSGCFVSTLQTNIGKEFINLNYSWMESVIVLKEPSATDKLVDLEAALDFNRYYLNLSGDSVRLKKADLSYAQVKEIQKKMKLNMPFLFRNK